MSDIKLFDILRVIFPHYPPIPHLLHEEARKTLIFGHFCSKFSNFPHFYPQNNFVPAPGYRGTLFCSLMGRHALFWSPLYGENIQDIYIEGTEYFGVSDYPLFYKLRGKGENGVRWQCECTRVKVFMITVVQDLFCSSVLVYVCMCLCLSAICISALAKCSTCLVARWGTP